jgi:hypothetical protein
MSGRPWTLSNLAARCIELSIAEVKTTKFNSERAP